MSANPSSTDDGRPPRPLSQRVREAADHAAPIAGVSELRLAGGYQLAPSTVSSRAGHRRKPRRTGSNFPAVGERDAPIPETSRRSASRLISTRPTAPFGIDRDFPAPFVCDVILEDGRACVAPVGELDLAGVPTLERTIVELRECGFDDLILDLRNLSFLDAAGLRSILALGGASRADAVKLELIAGPANVQRVFELTGTLDRLPFGAPTPTPAREPLARTSS